MSYIILTIWAFVFVALGIRLAIEIMIAEWKFDLEQRKWTTMIHNRKLNERILRMQARSEIMRRRGI